jgi:hypothetical protein
MTDAEEAINMKAAELVYDMLEKTGWGTKQ